MDKNQFTELVLESEVSMYRIAKSILVRECDCEDAMQEAVLKAYENLDSLHEERYFKTWLTRILINEARRIRKSQARLLLLEDSAVESIGMEHNRLNERSELYDAIMRLKLKIRITVVLHYIEGYSVEETAKILRVPTGTVKSRLHSGRTLLRKELEDE
ncbi:MAG: sigma-70 family RNA polymerase sigma factor [Oscillospiraceae bacterium]|nr:sigma-70 family RNA polymerase sigma factor [Oscillospiraceae bacterium]